MRRQCRLAALGLTAAALATPGRAAAAPVFYGPSPYLSAADSPFAGLGLAPFYLETFEDGLLNVPGVEASPNWLVLGPGVSTDSVDGDDGTIDGFGTAGHSFYSNGTEGSLTFTFDATVFGDSLPTYVGIVWTDVGLVSGGTQGFGGVSFEATGPMGVPLGGIGPFTLGDGLSSGETAEDRFFGVFNADGVRSVTIHMGNSTDWEVDHLQFGFGPAAAVPEPASVALLAAGGLGLLAASRRRG